MLADLHLHSHFSDGSDSPETLIKNILKSEISVFALTDHDTVDGILPMKSFLPDGVRFLAGVEFSCICDAGKCHILGLGIDPENDALQKALKMGEDIRREKLAKRLIHLENNHGIVWNEKEMAYIRAQNRVGKPHLAKLLIARGLATDLTDAIKKYLDLPEGKSDRIPAEEAIHAILHAGGIPVWAHPLGGEGEKTLTANEFRTLLSALLSYGIQGLECYYSRYHREMVNFLIDEAKKHDLLISGGSDYHGTNKNIALGELNAEKRPVDAEKLTVLTHLL